jgi:hypothetical protein
MPAGVRAASQPDLQALNLSTTDVDRVLRIGSPPFLQTENDLQTNAQVAQAGQESEAALLKEGRMLTGTVAFARTVTAGFTYVFGELRLYKSAQAAQDALGGNFGARKGWNLFNAGPVGSRRWAAWSSYGSGSPHANMLSEIGFCRGLYVFVGEVQAVHSAFDARIISSLASIVDNRIMHPPVTTTAAPTPVPTTQGMQSKAILNTFSAAYSYSVAISYVNQTYPQDPGYSMQAAYTVVGQGSAPPFYLTLSSNQRVFEEVVRRGDRACIRTSSTWKCGSVHDTQYSTVSALSPTFVLLGGEADTQLTLAGTRTVRGRQENGYKYTGTTFSGIIWLDARTGHLTEETGTYRGVMIAAQTMTYLFTATVSHWNDPHLRLPAVTGL